MKRIILSCLAVLMLGMGGCTQNTPPREEIVQEGITRVVFSENEEDLLKLLGLDNDVWVYEYQVPQEVKKIQVDFMNLVDGEWGVNESSYIVPDEVQGKIAFRRDINGVIKCNFQSGMSIISFSSNGLSEQYSSKAWSFLEENETIEIGNPITIAILYYTNDGVIRAFGTEQYDNVELFENADFVQAIRVTFLPEE